ncbi:MAG: GtrA family protein [Bacteroidota bacterium]
MQGLRALVQEYVGKAPTSEKEFLKVQMFRFLLTGGSSFALDVLLLFGLVRLVNLHYLVSNLLAFTVVNLYNYVLSRHWVYGAGSRRLRMELLVFFLVVAVGLGINQIFLSLFYEVLGLDLLLSKSIATIITVLWNFISKKFVVF